MKLPHSRLARETRRISAESGLSVDTATRGARLVQAAWSHASPTGTRVSHQASSSSRRASHTHSAGAGPGARRRAPRQRQGREILSTTSAAPRFAQRSERVALTRELVVIRGADDAGAQDAHEHADILGEAHLAARASILLSGRKPQERSERPQKPA